MKRFVLLFLSFILTACSACIDDEELVRLECLPGEKQVCTFEGEAIPSLDPDNPPSLSGQCSYGLRICTIEGWGDCFGAVGK